MARKSKKRQNRKKHSKPQSYKEKKKIHENQSKQNFDEPNKARLNGIEASEFNHFYPSTIIRNNSDSDSDPDCCDFLAENDLNRTKSDSALSRLQKYSSDISSFDVDSTQNEFECDLFDFYNFNQRSIMDKILTTKLEEFPALNLKNKLKIYSHTQLKVNSMQTPPRSSPATDFIDQLHMDNEVCLKDSCDNSYFESRNPSNVKLEKSLENLNQQFIMRLNDEVPELGITNIPPRRLNSTSNILEANSPPGVLCNKSSLCKANSIQESAVQIFENKQFSDDSFKDFSQIEDYNKEEEKIYLESKNNEKNLHGFTLNEEPKNRSTPILKTSKQPYERKVSSPNLNMDSMVSSSEITNDEYHSCCKECFNSDESLDEDESSSAKWFESCSEVPNKSVEHLKVIPTDYKEKEKKDSKFKNISIQCDLIKEHAQEEVVECDSSVDVLEKSCAKMIPSVSKTKNHNDNDVSTTYREFSDEDQFRGFTKVFTKISLQKFLYVLSNLPMDKILEFFCLTFSIPFVETMAISVSVTKVMNILTAIVTFPNFSHQLKSYGSKIWDSIKTGFENFFDIFVKDPDEKLKSAQRESVCTCYCDGQKITDLEKKLKNLENELTKFQFVDKEIEKLKEITQALESAAKLISKAPVVDNTNQISNLNPNPAPSLAPPPPPPIPPPPPPPPPPAMSHNPLVITKKNPKLDDSISRPSITVEDLQKVVLKKVSTNKTNDQAKVPQKQGPVVSLEMLRSVKLRSSARKRTPAISPTRTPVTTTSRDRIRKLRSPSLRSTSRSGDRKSRFSNIPLSKILNMDDSYQLLESKINENSRT